MSDSISTDTMDATAAPIPTAETANLSIADIQNAIRVIDYAAEQGAFKGWQTIEQVLVVRNRMNAFLTAVAPAAQETATDASV